MAKKETYSTTEVAKYLSDAPKAISAYISDLEEQIQNLAHIGLALSKERDMDKLLEMILLEAKRIANSDGGTLYTFDPDFGGFASFEFGIGNITKIDDVTSPFVLNVFPNPTSDKVTVTINSVENSTLSVSITNSMLVKIMEKEFYKRIGL